MHPVYYVPAGDVLPIFFATYGGTNGESVTMTGLAVTDIEIYKDGSATQRASDAGYTLLDTDGTDFDGITGIHGFSIDTGDNTDSGFYTVGAWFTVVVSAVTVSSQTVSFIAAQFRIMAAEGVAGVPDVNTTHISDTSQTARDIGASVLLSSGTGTGQVTLTSGRVNADVTHIATAAVSASTAQLGVNVVNVGGSAVSATSGLLNANVTQISGDSAAADALESYCDGTTPQPVNVTTWSGTSVASPDTAGYPKVTIKSGTGTGEISLSSGRVAVQSGIRKNQALANFPFLMTDSTNHNPATGLTVSGTRSIDGASFASGTIANMTEVGNGVYQCDLGAGDLNGDTIALRFTATGADDLVITIVTEP